MPWVIMKNLFRIKFAAISLQESRRERERERHAREIITCAREVTLRAFKFADFSDYTSHPVVTFHQTITITIEFCCLNRNLEWYRFTFVTWTNALPKKQVHGPSITCHLLPFRRPAGHFISVFVGNWASACLNDNVLNVQKRRRKEKRYPLPFRENFPSCYFLCET